MSDIHPFFELTLPDGDICKFGNRSNEPHIMENRFVYTFTLSNDAGRYEAVLTENTIGAALQEMGLYVSEHHITFWWHVHPTIQWDMAGWTVEQLMDTTIGNHLNLCMTIVEGPATRVNTYIAPLLQDDIVEEYQMGPWMHEQTLRDELLTWRTRQAAVLPDLTLPPLYSDMDAPLSARQWDTYEEEEEDVQQAENTAHISSIIIDKATELLATSVALSALN